MGNERFPTRVSGQHLFINGGAENFEALFPEWFYRNLQMLKSSEGTDTGHGHSTRGRQPKIDLATLNKAQVEAMLGQRGFIENELPTYRQVDMKGLLRKLNLPISGNKSDLEGRLMKRALRLSDISSDDEAPAQRRQKASQTLKQSDVPPLSNEKRKPEGRVTNVLSLKRSKK